VDEAVVALASGDTAIEWLRVDPAAVADDGLSAASLGPLRRLIVDAGRAILRAADVGDGAGAMGALQGFRVLCAHRRGPWGVGAWTQRIEGWLATAVEGFSPATPWYLGRPVMVTANDYGLRLFNGDTGVVVARPGEGVAVVFRRPDGLTLMNPSRLGTLETVFAMTVHKAQGSEFDEVAVVLPPPESPVLNRELLYTAVTRARRRLIVVGGEDSVRAAVSRPISRASGLTERLWV
jgi:exodeoxyribonuclease V alpha subunit